MKKGRGGKRKQHKVSHKKIRRRFFFNDRIFTFLFIAVFLSFAVLLAFVDKGNITGQPLANSESFSEKISGMFDSWKGGNLDLNIVKYLFFIMLTGFIWGVLSFANFPGGKMGGVFQAFIAIPAGFLGVTFLTPAELFTILTGYEALGIVLTSIVPFMIILFCSAALSSKAMSVPKVIFEVFLWIFFGVVLAYKIISGLANGEIPLGLNLPLLLLMITFLITLLIIIFNKGFRDKMWKIQLEIREKQAELGRLEAVEGIETGNAISEALKKGTGT